MSVFRGADFEEMTDEQLALLAHEGCEDAFSQLVRRCASIIRQHAAMYRSVQLESEDLEQEGLVGLLSAVRTYQESGGASFRTYASVCIRRRMLSAVRRVGAARQIPSSELVSMDGAGSSLSEESAAPTDPAVLLQQREDADQFQDRVRETLTQMEYQVLMLYLGAYSYEEIAQLLHSHTKAVDNALQRVRRKLAAALTDDGSVSSS